MPGSNIDLPASPYTVVAFGAGDGRVVTYQGMMSLEAAVQLMVASLEDFDWPALQMRGRETAGGLAGYEEMLDLVSLVAEINLYLARLVWSIKVPPSIGLPRLLASAHEADELRYLANLATQRSLADDELALHLLEQGEFMSQWGEARRVLVTE
ncbi:MAG TPA: hypothetical protein PKE27_15900 [Povalibacter sp.]|uniref:hypothetical protein n=1 Tax=Povalibacter sp. TaxID=1962978 RepID=UPI002B7E11BE|nr:hypothetical protein [Povalibacter sp.]HMN46062.1 hypothetical protein [Povalibacter sp.]